MADNYLITGYWGEPHVTAENDRGINAAIFGTGRFVLPVGEQFKAEYIGNNTVRLYDGKLMDNGAAAGIPAGRYVDLLISEAGQGMNRNDLIVFQYAKDASTLVESGVFTVIKGTETSGTAEDPALNQEDLLSDEATFDQMALWRVSVSAAVISAPVQLFSVSPNMRTAGASSFADLTGTASVAQGGTGATDANTARKNLGITPANIGAAPTSHGNHVPKTGTADNATFLRNDNTWQKVTPANIGAAASLHGIHVPATQTANNATFLRNDNSWQKVTPDNIGAIPKAGGAMTGALTLKGIKLTSGTDYGSTLPASPAVGQLFFLDADVADELGL